MMRWITGFLAAVMLTSPVMANAPWWAPSPLSLAITVGQWINRDQVKVYHVRVKAQAATEQAAREEAFRLAVEMAVGSLVTAEVQVRDRELLRKEIISYSSGYVHDFELIRKLDLVSGVELELDVWVKKSTIADRLLNVSKDSDQLNETQISTQFDTLLAERDRGDRVLEQVLSDYPQRAFDIKVLNTRTRIDSRRRLEYEINVNLSWSQTYLRALHEAVAVTATRHDVSNCFRGYCNHDHLVRIKYRPDGEFFIKGIDAAYDDEIKRKIFERHISHKNPHIMVHVHDGFGVTAFQGCFSHSHLTWTNYMPSERFVHWDLARTVVNGQLETQPRLVFSVTDPNLAKKIEVSVVPESMCR